MIRFTAGQRKAEVMAPYLQAAAEAGRSRVVAIGCAQEFQLVWTTRKRDTDPGGCPQFSFTREQRRVSVFYVYIFDEQMGPYADRPDMPPASPVAGADASTDVNAASLRSRPVKIGTPTAAGSG